ncbi:hypothetical protein [Haploplasma axanthum]|uniref:Uncharacterized protein n=1 Tax=Haploplasma axanthum TaxID=29552 RepID=A0A449BFZ0_HAPAX|nr:hypothetical protein [Haploplasma axanthum]VEU79544.1 Uncharacterised protein [Haploplasma axanthum]VEU81339.1 Uncharacterised protein [Haploplasma axanthum]VEU81358.1 Uncharacterised protein [Haploplasma axanthum]VEU81375.1 Uncharacterised protein [Haploplasma axanthum]
MNIFRMILDNVFSITNCEYNIQEIDTNKIDVITNSAVFHFENQTLIMVNGNYDFVKVKHIKNIVERMVQDFGEN